MQLTRLALFVNAQPQVDKDLIFQLDKDDVENENKLQETTGSEVENELEDKTELGNG